MPLKRSLIDERQSSEIESVDLGAQMERVRHGIERAVAKVFDHGRFIMGPEVAELEEELTHYAGSRACVSCSSGTDALLMVLMAWGIGPGDAVFLPSFTFAATAEVVALLGASPVFVDVHETTFNLDVESLEAAFDVAEGAGLQPVAIIGVDLFGLPADWSALTDVARTRSLKLLADAAQSFGGGTPAGRVGTLADATTTSFFPAKPLGCYGDGGAIFTRDLDLAEALRSIRVHGQGESKYDTLRVGINGRLDTIQAAILLEKLKIFDAELDARQRVATRYSAELRERLAVPLVPEGFRSAWAQYTVRVPRRDHVRAALEDAGIPAAIYYPKPLHLQPAYSSALRSAKGLDVSDALSRDVLSLPVHPYLSDADQSRVIKALVDAI